MTSRTSSIYTSESHGDDDHAPKIMINALDKTSFDRINVISQDK